MHWLHDHGPVTESERQVIHMCPFPIHAGAASPYGLAVPGPLHPAAVWADLKQLPPVLLTYTLIQALEEAPLEIIDLPTRQAGAYTCGQRAVTSLSIVADWTSIRGTEIASRAWHLGTYSDDNTYNDHYAQRQRLTLQSLDGFEWSHQVRSARNPPVSPLSGLRHLQRDEWT